MSEIAIKVENLSKIYRLGEIGTGTLSRDLERWWRMSVLGQEDPFLKIGQVNDRTQKGESDVVYSLKDINFEIKQGDAVGIIGRNGAGKSTLLKILSRVTSPTSGKIHVKGRVASLLEVGTGFHPELTGRENIFLNGAILGMRKKEIARKLDEIIEFSGVELYIDTPVKRYSSGMYVRLAFAVAAHLESEILVIDEVLAVGDAEFQKKCLGKMNEVSRGEGRTVLFVSHNMSSIQSLCSNCILLDNGRLIRMDLVNEVIKYYFKSDQLGAREINGSLIKITNVSCNDQKRDFVFANSDSVTVHFDLSVEYYIKNINIFLIIKGEQGENLLHYKSECSDLSEAKYKFEFKIPPLNLRPSFYNLEIKIIGAHKSGVPFRYVMAPITLTFIGEVNPALLKGVLAPEVKLEKTIIT